MYAQGAQQFVDEQLSNDPGGDHWIRLIDDAVEMFYDHIKTTQQPRKGSERDDGHNARRDDPADDAAEVKGWPGRNTSAPLLMRLSRTS